MLTTVFSMAISYTPQHHVIIQQVKVKWSMSSIVEIKPSHLGIVTNQHTTYPKFLHIHINSSCIFSLCNLFRNEGRYLNIKRMLNLSMDFLLKNRHCIRISFCPSFHCPSFITNSAMPLASNNTCYYWEVFSLHCWISLATRTCKSFPTHKL